MGYYGCERLILMIAFVIFGLTIDRVLSNVTDDHRKSEMEVFYRVNTPWIKVVPRYSKIALGSEYV
jgi:phage-related holin